MGESHQTDVAIIGAGPVGLFAVFECGMLKLHCHVIDALDAVGGQCIALYPEKPIYDIPGFPEIEAAALIDRLAEQAAPFDPGRGWGRGRAFNFHTEPISSGSRRSSSSGIFAEKLALRNDSLEVFSSSLRTR